MDTNKEFVTFKQALALKELEFDKPVIGFYNHNNPHYECGYFHMNTEHMFSDDITTTKQSEFCVSAPTYSQAFRWFRDNYKLHSSVDFDQLKDKNDEEDIELYYYKINQQWSKGKDWTDYKYGFKHIDIQYSFKSYEEAEQACLNKLIEIVKNDKSK